MPEDTPGNPGVLFAGPDDESGDDAEEGFAAEGGDFFPVGTEEGAPPSGDRVRGMQAKLHHWAGGDASRRFDDLWNLVCDYDFLARSWDLVRSNRGARTPGVDGVRAVDVQFRDGGVSGFLEEIRGQLRDGTYRPSANARGISTFADRACLPLVTVGGRARVTASCGAVLRIGRTFTASTTPAVTGPR